MLESNSANLHMISIGEMSTCSFRISSGPLCWMVATCNKIYLESQIHQLLSHQIFLPDSFKLVSRESKTFPPIKMVQLKMGVSPIRSFVRDFWIFPNTNTCKVVVIQPNRVSYLSNTGIFHQTKGLWENFRGTNFPHLATLQLLFHPILQILKVRQPNCDGVRKISSMSTKKKTSGPQRTEIHRENAEMPGSNHSHL